MQMPRAELEAFQDNLAEICAEHGEIQRVADAANISRVYLSRIIHGHVSPSYEVCLQIAEAVGESLAELSQKRRKKIRQTA
jgi:transcriptional regulator with XRE-family HTH domain